MRGRAREDEGLRVGGGPRTVQRDESNCEEHGRNRPPRSFPKGTDAADGSVFHVCVVSTTTSVVGSGLRSLQ